MLFSKTEYKELFLPFIYDYNPDDIENGIISIEAYGNVFGEEKYCYANYDLSKKEMYDNGEYEQIIRLLKNSPDKNIKITFKIKREKIKNFKIDLDSLAAVYNDERLKLLELLGWGLNDKSFKELENRYEGV